MVPFILCGWVTVHRRIFYQATCLLVMSILINFSLKCTFQVPLLSHLHKVGFAFPSGHMQSVIVLYGWLAAHFNYVAKGMVTIIWIGTAWSLHYFGYHDYIDLIGGFCVGIGCLIFYHTASLYGKEKISGYLFLIACLLLIYVDMHHAFIPFYVWQAYWTLIGLLVFDKIKS